MSDKTTQTTTPEADDFLQECEAAGIEIIIPAEGEEGGTGGGSSFVPRLTPPSYTDKNWIHYTKGGYNYCIQIDASGSVLPNCVGYAWGRQRELLGAFHNFGRGDAKTWWTYADGYARTQTPELGAVAVWTSDGCGHVATVEGVDEAGGGFTAGNSAYNGARFYISKHKPPYNIGRKYQLLGFIKCPRTFSALDIEEVNGSDRQETARRMAPKGYKAAVVIGDSAPDAYSAAIIARKNGAPVFFDRSGLPRVPTYYTVGAVESTGGTPYQGSNRYETNLAVLKDQKRPYKIAVISGSNEADGIGTITSGLPVLLAGDFLCARQILWLAQIGGKIEFIIIGGENAVSATVAAQLGEFGSVKRIAGADRYETAKLAAEYFWAKAKTAAVVQSWVDAATCALLDAPVLLIGPGHTDDARRFIEAHKIKTIKAVGGIPKETLDQLR